MKLLLLIAVCVAAASATMVPKKLAYKFTLRKTMESCLGEEVRNNFYQEWLAAYAKCRGGAHERTSEEQELEDAVDSVMEEEESPVVNVRRRRSHHTFTPEKLQKMNVTLQHKISNWTCVLKELNMLGDDGVVHNELIKKRILDMNLPSEQLTKDMVEGSDKCVKMARCIPESVAYNHPISLETNMNMMYMKCLKMVKIESCMKVDFRRKMAPKLQVAGDPTAEEEAFNLILSSSAVDEMMKDM